MEYANGRLDIAIQTEDPELARALLKQLAAEQAVGVHEVRVIHERGDELMQLVMAAINIAGAAGLGVLSNWIWENLRGRSVKVRVNRREMDLDDRGQVQKIMEEEIEYR